MKNERKSNTKRDREREGDRVKEREKLRELLYTKNMSEWMAAGEEEKEGKIVCDGMRIVSKEALVLIKLASVFSTAM